MLTETKVWAKGLRMVLALASMLRLGLGNLRSGGYEGEERCVGGGWGGDDGMSMGRKDPMSPFILPDYSLEVRMASTR